MASTLNKLTGMGGDVRKIAALLQKKAPPGHRLAYINDEEAALLKARGGSGKPHADTGIPSYQDESLSSEIYQDYGPPSTGTTYMPTPTGGYDVASELAPSAIAPASQLYAPPSASDFGVQQFGTPASQLSGGAGQGIYAAPSALTTDISIPESPKYGLTSGQSIAGVTGTAPEKEEGIADRLAKGTGLSKDTLGRLGLAGLTGVIGARQAGRAGQAGQAGAEQMKALAAPYQQQGAQIQAQAQRGELTPQAQQSLQAVQAQAAQSAERRGGVGQAQMQAQVEAFRQQLLAQQYDYGLKLSGIGDNIALGAIRTGLQADQYVNQLTSNYYSNIARTAYGIAPQVAGTTAAG
jgi:hypothetical protein